jgi:hypothetical protein
MQSHLDTDILQAVRESNRDVKNDIQSISEQTIQKLIHVFMTEDRMLDIQDGKRRLQHIFQENNMNMDLPWVTEEEGIYRALDAIETLNDNIQRKIEGGVTPGDRIIALQSQVSVMETNLQLVIDSRDAHIDAAPSDATDNMSRLVWIIELAHTMNMELFLVEGATPGPTKENPSLVGAPSSPSSNRVYWALSLAILYGAIATVFAIALLSRHPSSA